MKILMTGSRHWRRPSVIKDWMRKLPPGVTVLHTNNLGAGQIIDGTARELDIECVLVVPNWKELTRENMKAKYRGIFVEYTINRLIAFLNYIDIVESQIFIDLAEEFNVPALCINGEGDKISSSEVLSGDRSF